jgi:hypothetical protein
VSGLSVGLRNRAVVMLLAVLVAGCTGQVPAGAASQAPSGSARPSATRATPRPTPSPIAASPSATVVSPSPSTASGSPGSSSTAFACGREKLPDRDAMLAGWTKPFLYFQAGCTGPHAIGDKSAMVSCSVDEAGFASYQLGAPDGLRPNYDPPDPSLRGRVWLAAAIWFAEDPPVYLIPWVYIDYTAMKAGDGALSWDTDGTWYNLDGSIARRTDAPYVIDLAVRDPTHRARRAAAAEWYSWWDASDFNGRGSGLNHINLASVGC